MENLNNVNLNKLKILLNELNKCLDIAKENDGNISYSLSKNKYNDLCDSYNELKDLVLTLENKNDDFKPMIGDWVWSLNQDGGAFIFKWNKNHENNNILNYNFYEKFIGKLPKKIQE